MGTESKKKIVGRRPAGPKHNRKAWGPFIYYNNKPAGRTKKWSLIIRRKNLRVHKRFTTLKATQEYRDEKIREYDEKKKTPLIQTIVYDCAGCGGRYAKKPIKCKHCIGGYLFEEVKVRNFQ